VAVELYYQVQVTAGGAAYDLSSDLASFTLDEQEGRPDQLTLRVPDPYKVFSHAFQEGMEVMLDLGTTEDHAIVFRGRIHQADADFPQDATPTLTLHAHDRAQQMGLRRRSPPPWVDRKLSEIVAEIAMAHGFKSADVRVGGDPLFDGNGIRQQNETDLEFLLRLAADWACQMYVDPADGDVLRFLSQKNVMSELQQVTLYYGRCGVPDRLLSFQPRSDVADIQLPRVFSGVDYTTGEMIAPASAQEEDEVDTEDAFLDENLAAFREREPERAGLLEGIISAAPDVRTTLLAELGTAHRVATPAFTTPENIEARRLNQLSTSALGMRASGSTVGNMRLHAQTAVRLADVGGRFSGTWFLSQVRHVLDAQGYRTEFEARR
jgi:phage protein D